MGDISVKNCLFTLSPVARSPVTTERYAWIGATSLQCMLKVVWFGGLGTMAHKCHSTHPQDISSYFSSCCLICMLYHPISTHVILFASYIVVFQLILSYLQVVSSYYNSCRLISRLCYLILTHTILFTTTYLQTSFHPICIYVMLF